VVTLKRDDCSLDYTTKVKAWDWQWTPHLDQNRMYKNYVSEIFFLCNCRGRVLFSSCSNSEG